MIVICNFGDARSGTTLIKKMFMQANGYLSFKLAEGHALHPWNSNTGLIDVAGLFKEHKIVFVRTLRHPIDIMESLCFIHSNVAEMKEFRRRLRLLKNGFVNTKKQIPILKAPSYYYYIAKVVLIDVYYEDLGNIEKRREFFNQVTTFFPCSEEAEKIKNVWGLYLADVWNKKPVRKGRLMSNENDRILSKEHDEIILAELSDMIDEEGLRGKSKYVND